MGYEKDLDDSVSQKVWELAFKKGLTISEIAKELSISTKSVTNYTEKYIDRELLPSMKLGVDRHRAMQFYELERVRLFQRGVLNQHMMAVAQGKTKVDLKLIESYQKLILQQSKLLGTESVAVQNITQVGGEFPIHGLDAAEDNLKALSDEELQKRYLETLANS
ncbi:MAG TPA: hypothetical protein VIQ31_35620 [Phormidium sp.]